ncbi:hypothetical protein [Acinetobacter haemolyticus]|uniref:hypothetical protein n=1 Tax=Acinetobacter haemolyticus TaxID=29430 RepID=UPI0002D2EAD6|nr:hypothetical protein [Acinetobacter haemolyticus]
MTLPNLESDLLPTPTFAEVQAKELSHPPRILLLYGSNRERSYSRLAVMEAGRILERFGCVNGILKLTPFTLQMAK